MSLSPHSIYPKSNQLNVQTNYGTHHIFGDLVNRHLSQQYSLSLSALSEKSDVEYTTLCKMCKGERLTGGKSRERVLRVIRGLYDCGVLECKTSANALLEAAGKSNLRKGASSFEDNLILLLKDHRESPITVVRKEEDIYASAISLIHERQFNKICVYAPAGMWQVSQHKPKWLKALADHLKKRENAEALMIFGVPYWQGGLNYMEGMLSVFDGHSAISIRYIPPIKGVDPVPTIGMIVFDADIVAVGFGIRQKMEKIDAAWSISEKQAAQIAYDWFQKIWSEHNTYELQVPNRMSFSEGFSIMQKRYADQLCEKRSLPVL